MRFGMGIRVRDELATHMVNRRTLEEAREALRSKEPGGLHRAVERR